jgi:hypothetical protein
MAYKVYGKGKMVRVVYKVRTGQWLILGVKKKKRKVSSYLTGIILPFK